MSEFMPNQPNRIKAPLLVGTVILGIGMFLFSYTKYGSILLSLGVTVVSTGLLFFLLKGFLVKRSNTRHGKREFDPTRRRK